MIREALDSLPEERCGFFGRILLSVKKGIEGSGLIGTEKLWIAEGGSMIENCMASRLTFHLAEQLLNGEALSKKELAIELNISYAFDELDDEDDDDFLD